MASCQAHLRAEIWTALATTVESAPVERGAYLRRRCDNLQMLYAWHVIDRDLHERAACEVLALYLALGWTQATTTWQWPGTDRWIEILSGSPPAHWMPRSQWHLCWLLHDPQSAEHRRALDDALLEGLEDTERPGAAAALAEELGIELPDRPAAKRARTRSRRPAPSGSRKSTPRKGRG